MQLVNLFLIGFISALLSSATGAGAALFATPLLVLVGIPLPNILAANQLAASLWTPVAASNYIKNDTLDYKLIIYIALTGILGVIVGYSLIKFLPVYLLKQLIGGLIICIVILVSIKNSLLSPTNPTKRSLFKLILIGLPLGIYQSVFGSGNTLFSSIFFCRLRGFEFKQSLAHSYSIAFVWCSITAILFYLDGNMDWNVCVPISFGALIGAYLGSKFGSSISTQNLQKLFLIFGGIMGFKLLLFS